MHSSCLAELCWHWELSNVNTGFTLRLCCCAYHCQRLVQDSPVVLGPSVMCFGIPRAQLGMYAQLCWKERACANIKKQLIRCSQELLVSWFGTLLLTREAWCIWYRLYFVPKWYLLWWCPVVSMHCFGERKLSPAGLRLWKHRHYKWLWLASLVHSFVWGNNPM